MTDHTSERDRVELFDNDPNRHRYDGKVFRLTFGQWRYRSTFEATVFGNCSGFENLESAVDQVADGLPEGSWGLALKMTAPDGEELLCESEDESPEEWLLGMLVGAELVGFAKDGA